MMYLSKLNAFAHGQGALQGKARNLIFAHECDARMGLSVDDELFEHLRAGRATGDTIVRAHRHHAPPRSGLGIERVELHLEIVSIHGRAEVPSLIVHDVVHVECVGHDSKWFVAHVNQERLVAAYVVSVVDEAERLKNLQGMRSAAQPESVEADWPRTGRSLDALDTLLIRDALFFRSHGELCSPGLPVSGCFVPTLNDLFCERRVQVDRCADHMGSDLDLATVKDFEEPRQTLLVAESYHLLAGRSGYFGSIFGIGLSAPLAGCAPPSICIETETTMRAPSGQKEPAASLSCSRTGFANATDDGTAPAMAARAPALIKLRREVIVLLFLRHRQVVKKTRAGVV